MTPQLDELFSNKFAMRKALEQVLPKEAVDYILLLIVKDSSHRRFLEITEENET